jgi:hypothetical protein
MRGYEVVPRRRSRVVTVVALKAKPSVPGPGFCIVARPATARLLLVRPPAGPGQQSPIVADRKAMRPEIRAMGSPTTRVCRRNHELRTSEINRAACSSTGSAAVP